MLEEKAWNPVWETIYRSREWGKYPVEDLIRFTARNYYGVPDRKAVRLLDLGCGVGSATWYLAREGFSVSAVDGSATAVRKLGERLAEERLSAELHVGDIVSLPFPDEFFDGVIDLVCLMCNGKEATRRIVREIVRVLKPGGLLFSYTPRRGCHGDGIGTPEGPGEFSGATEGPFAGMGLVRFTAEEDIPELYSPLTVESLETLDRSIDDRTRAMSFWAIACRKSEG